MKKELKTLILIYLGFVLIKAVLSYFIPSSRALADDYNYLKMSESFFYHFSLKVHGVFTGQFYPLYPILISIVHIFQDNNLVYLFIKIINLVLSSLIIFPAYYLSKEFLSKKKSLLSATLISLLPSNFALSSYIMAENIFYVLFLTSIYFIYRVFKYKTKKDYIFCAIFVILSLLTRIHGLILIGSILILLIFNHRGKFSLKHLILPGIIITLIAILFYFNTTISELYIGRYLSLISSKESLAFFIKYISYFGFLLLSSGLILIIPFFISLRIKNEKLKLFRLISLITLGITLLISSIHALGSPRYFYSINDITLVSGRTIGRYVDFCLPLIIILGLIGLNYYYENKDKLQNNLLKRITILSSIIMLITTSIILSPLAPLNNISLTFFGVIKYLIEIVLYSNASFEFGSRLLPFLILSLIFVLIPIIIYHVLKKFNYKKFISLLLIILILSAFSSLFVVYYASKTSWYYNSEQRELALYLNKIDPKRSLVLIDERDNGDLVDVGKNDPSPGKNEKALYGGPRENPYTILGYWLNDELIIDNIENTQADYIISTYNLNLSKIYETKNEIYLYKNEKQ